MAEKLTRKERAIVLAQLSQQIIDPLLEKRIQRAEETLLAAEDFVAEKYGEFR